MPEQSTFDNVSQSIFGFFDKVNQGLKTYWDGRIAANELQAKLAYSEAQKNSARTLAELEQGSAASNWGDPSNAGAGMGIDFSNPQTLLIGGAIALVAIAVLRGK